MTKERSNQLKQYARDIVASLSEDDIQYPLSFWNEPLRGLRAQMVEEMNCHKETAKINLKNAIYDRRNGTVAPDGWGGHRTGAMKKYKYVIKKPDSDTYRNNANGWTKSSNLKWARRFETRQAANDYANKYGMLSENYEIVNTEETIS